MHLIKKITHYSIIFCDIFKNEVVNLYEEGLKF